VVFKVQDGLDYSGTFFGEIPVGVVQEPLVSLLIDAAIIAIALTPIAPRLGCNRAAAPAFYRRPGANCNPSL
jgi:hypothetical protein